MTDNDSKKHFPTEASRNRTRSHGTYRQHEEKSEKPKKALEESRDSKVNKDG